MPPEADASPLTAGRAIVLGVIHGPAELLPVSSSAHVALVARLLGWDYEALTPDARKAFEVALHAGALVALPLIVRPPRLRTAILETLPPALAGVLLESPVERRLGGVRATAVGLVVGSLILVVADAAGRCTRDDDEPPTDRDALVIGLAQAAALAPGLSRLGMAVAAARLCGFSPVRAFALGRSAGLPVLLGAGTLKGARLAQRGLDPSLRAPFVAGAAAAAVSTLASRRLTGTAPVRACAAERVALAVAALRRGQRRNHR
jgi:undecaprenyl-diphosphatase